eukprot:scaffold1336_cov174-Amphora_coffeaeformis.AAC.4
MRTIIDRTDSTWSCWTISSRPSSSLVSCQWYHWLSLGILAVGGPSKSIDIEDIQKDKSIGIAPLLSVRRPYWSHIGCVRPQDVSRHPTRRWISSLAEICRRLKTRIIDRAGSRR